MAMRDSEGRGFVVTGATSGVGRAAVRGLVERGAEVIGASRSGARGDATAGLAMDLNDPGSLRRAAAELRSSRKHLDGLVNAAGAICWKPGATPFGVDQAWAVNYLGPVVLTRELWPLLEAAPRARVATVAGNPTFLRRLRFDPGLLATTPRSAMDAAGQAMAARVILDARAGPEAPREPGDGALVPSRPGALEPRRRGALALAPVRGRHEHVGVSRLRHRGEGGGRSGARRLLGRVDRPERQGAPVRAPRGCEARRRGLVGDGDDPGTSPAVRSVSRHHIWSARPHPTPQKGSWVNRPRAGRGSRTGAGGTEAPGQRERVAADVAAELALTERVGSLLASAAHRRCTVHGHLHRGPCVRLRPTTTPT